MRNILFTHYLDTNGDGTGTKNANGNYSGAVEEFYIQAAAGEIIEIQRMIVTIEDTGGSTVQEYGNLGVALTNGIEVHVENEYGTIMSDLTGELPIKTNGDWSTHCHDVTWLDKGAGDDLISVRWTFSKHGTDLELQEGQRFVVKLNDDLSGLISHYFVVQGWYP